MNDNIKNIELIKKSYEELQDEVIKLTTDKFILQSNWNSLREFINDWIEDLENQRESIEGTDLFENHTLVILDDIKIRMNELERKDKE